MPPNVVGGQERLSAEVLRVLKSSVRVLDSANYGQRWTQWAFLAGLPLKVRRMQGQSDWIDLSDGSLAVVRPFVKKPCLLRANGLDMTLRNPAYQRMLRRYLPQMAGIVSNSRAMKAIVMAKGVPSERILVVCPPASAPPSYRANPEPGRLLLLGRLVKKKGQREFLRDVWPLVASARPDVRLDIVGDGPLRDEIMELIQKAPGKERIDYRGQLPQDQLEVAFAKAQLLLMTSRPTPGDFEGFGMVSAEAAVRGLPTIAYATDGVVDAVRHDLTGLVAPGFTPQDMATTIIEGLEREFQCHEVAAQGERTWGRERFARQYIAAINQFCDLDIRLASKTAKDP